MILMYINIIQFYIYAKNWWQGYLSIDPQFSKRYVKLFALNDKGIKRCVCTFITPIKLSILHIFRQIY